MPSQYEKRKAKATKDVVEKRAKVRKTKEVKKDLTNLAFDVILNNKGRHELVIIKYNPETRMAEVDEIKPCSRDVGVSFEIKKTALKTLAHIK